MSFVCPSRPLCHISACTWNNHNFALIYETNEQLPSKITRGPYFPEQIWLPFPGARHILSELYSRFMLYNVQLEIWNIGTNLVQTWIWGCTKSITGTIPARWISETVVLASIEMFNDLRICLKFSNATPVSKFFVRTSWKPDLKPFS